jgi:hypothetical protein
LWGFFESKGATPVEHVIAPADVYLPATGEHHKRGEPVEVDDETAASLKDQGWKTARMVAAERREARKQREAQADEPAPDEAAPAAPDTTDAGPPADPEE